jgi:DNA-binding MarR family transcriptional regulator
MAETLTATPTPTTPADELELPARLRLAITRMARRLRQEAGADLSPSQGAALATIERHGPLAPSELAARERITRPTVTRILERLERAGLVERARDPADGRCSIVSATDQGRSLLRRLRRRKTAYLATRLRRLPAEDVTALTRAADVLERILEEDATGELRLPGGGRDSTAGGERA